MSIACSTHVTLTRPPTSSWQIASTPRSASSSAPASAAAACLAHSSAACLASRAACLEPRAAVRAAVHLRLAWGWVGWSGWAGSGGAGWLDERDSHSSPHCRWHPSPAARHPAVSPLELLLGRLARLQRRSARLLRLSCALRSVLALRGGFQLRLRCRQDLLSAAMCEVRAAGCSMHERVRHQQRQ